MHKDNQINPSLKENTTHGTVSFLVALYEWKGESEWHVVPHWHEELISRRIWNSRALNGTGQMSLQSSSGKMAISLRCLIFPHIH